MAIDFRCPGCDKVFRARDEQAAKRCKCRACGVHFFVPTFEASPPLVQVEEDYGPVRLTGGSKAKPRPVGSGVATAMVMASVAFTLVPLAVLAYLAANPMPEEWTARYRPWVYVAIEAGVGIVLPVVLSRLGILSIGRWLIMAACCVAFGALSVIFLFGSSGRAEDEAIRAIRPALGFLCAFCFFGVPGCLLAAAVHPKPPAR